VMKYYSFHGFNISDGGANTIGRLHPYLPLTDINYGWTWRLRVRLCNDCISSAIVNVVDNGSIAIAHSNGCLIASKAAKLGAPFSKLILINPALDTDYEFPSGIPVDVYYSPKDRATLLARFIPFSRWGAMGRYGYDGDNDNDNELVTNFNSEELFGSVSHSDVFDSAQKLAAHIESRL